MKKEEKNYYKKNRALKRKKDRTLYTARVAERAKMLC